MIPNTHPSGVAFGYVSAQDLSADLLDILMGYTSGAQQLINHTVAAALKQDEAEQRAAWEDECESIAALAQDEGRDIVLDDFEYVPSDDLNICEEVVEGVFEGVHYISSWLGGALNFMICESPMIATNANRASPCVPNAGILKPPRERNGDVLCFDVPPDWWWVDPNLPMRTFADQMGEFE